ncbi:MAG: hypothetical protein QOD74_685 [Variibacter sp.]|jgi:uncharacterized protein YjiS (DUF1127 family)|nr:hypothetical protein [Variibacter sp.]
MITSTSAIHDQAPSRLLAFVEALKVRAAVVVKAFRHRRDLEVLARFDDRMLSDIGLTRADLRDAAAEPVWRDGTEVLVARARERQGLSGRVRLIHRSNRAA